MLGRFISEDPIGFGGGDLNLHAYVGNSPTNLTDSNGKEAITISAAFIIGGLIVTTAVAVVVSTPAYQHFVRERAKSIERALERAREAARRKRKQREDNCQLLYDRCLEDPKYTNNPRWCKLPCDNCRTICKNEGGNWPWDKCPLDMYN